MTLETGVLFTILGIAFQVGIFYGIVKHNMKDMATRKDIENAILKNRLHYEKMLAESEVKVKEDINEVKLKLVALENDAG